MIARILAIAGSDSGGGAGIQADIKTITMLGGHAMTAITAITAQNTLGVDAVLPVSPDMVLAQIDAVVRDIGVDAIKIGMIGSAEVADAVADRLRAPDVAAVPVVFDPVMIATTGAVLADAPTTFAFARLLTRAAVSTPNLDELAALIAMPVGNEAEIGNAAAHLIEERGTGPILVTGIRVPGSFIREDGREESIDDLLSDRLFYEEDGRQERRWSGTRLATIHDHGTGCTLSSAIACGLGRGLGLQEAIAQARHYVRAALQTAPGLGGGHGPMGHGLGRAHFVGSD